MLQITAGLSSLSKAQREALAGFILTFPTLQPPQQTEDDEDAVNIPAFTVAGDQSPDEVFGGPSLVSAPPAPATEDSRLDKSGIPWDERIHASSRVKTADGLWRKKRGVDEATVAHVEAELKALMGLPAPAPNVPADEAAMLPMQNASTVPAPPPAPAPVPPPPPPAPVNDRQAFVNLISRASAAIGAKQLTQDQLNAAVVAAGVPSLPLLGNRLDLVPQVAAAVEAVIASAQ